MIPFNRLDMIDLAFYKKGDADFNLIEPTYFNDVSKTFYCINPREDAPNNCTLEGASGKSHPTMVLIFKCHKIQVIYFITNK